MSYGGTCYARYSICGCATSFTGSLAACRRTVKESGSQRWSIHKAHTVNGRLHNLTDERYLLEKSHA